MTNVFDVAKIVTDEWVKAHGDEICIIAYYGSHAQGTASPKSDLDLFYIPAVKTWWWDSWVVDDLPFEIWAISWETAEGMVTGMNRWPVAPSIFSHAKVLYYRTSEDLTRFEALKAKVAQLSSPANKQRFLDKATEEMKSLGLCLWNLNTAIESQDLTTIRICGRNLIGSVITILSYINQRYLNKGWDSALEEVDAFNKKPEDLINLIRLIVTSSDLDEIGWAGQVLADDARTFLLSELNSLRSGTPVDIVGTFNGTYNVIHEYTAKVVSRCQKGDIIGASVAALQMQDEFAGMLSTASGRVNPSDATIYSDFSEVYESMEFPNLVATAATGDLKLLSEQAVVFRETIRAWLNQAGCSTNEFADLVELKNYLESRHKGRSLTEMS